MEKDLVVELKLRSGKRYAFETEAFKQGCLQELIEDLELRGSSYIAIDENLFVRLSEIESFEDITHLQSDGEKADGYIKVDAAVIKATQSKEDINNIAEQIKKATTNLR